MAFQRPERSLEGPSGDPNRDEDQSRDGERVHGEGQDHGEDPIRGDEGRWLARAVSSIKLLDCIRWRRPREGRRIHFWPF